MTDVGPLSAAVGRVGRRRRRAALDCCQPWRPHGAPLLVAAFLSGTDRPTAELNPIHAEIGALAAGLI